MKHKIWIDNERPAPQGYTWCRNAAEFRYTFNWCFEPNEVEFIDIGNKFYTSLEMTEIINYMQEHMLNFPIHIHSTHTNNILLDAVIRKRYEELELEEISKLNEDYSVKIINNYLNGDSNNDL